jgi:formylglycine-generating enzyme required for sulfatase activity
VVPELSVSANEPEGGGVLSYQWFRNYDNNNRTGTRIEGATGTSYRLSEAEVSRAETVYYYVVITNTVGGKMGSMESMTRPVTFINKEDTLHIKSRDIVSVPGGTVSGTVYGTQWYYLMDSLYSFPWETDGFEMGKYPVTWELWKLVFDFAEAGGYHFASIGNQGAEQNSFTSTVLNPRPVGNELHPVTMVSWNDCVVWCNAYSEMEGLEPVYRDIRGNILRDARESPASLVDSYRMTGKNGYRLPNGAEWGYAALGADPTHEREGAASYNGRSTTWEVGSMMEHNDIGLYDMEGLVVEWGWDKSGDSRLSFGSLFLSQVRIGSVTWRMSEPYNNFYRDAYAEYNAYFGLRPIRYLDQGATP